jgi:hypothetical protein
MFQPTEPPRAFPGGRWEGGSRLGLSGYNAQRLGRSRRSTLSFFQQIAAATGGQVYETDKDHIGDVLNEVLEVVNIL